MLPKGNTWKQNEKDECIEANRLIERGVQFITDAQYDAIKTRNTAKEEYCVNSTLHRGYYNPSPVYDIIVGNEKRGKLSKNPLAETITHRYYYNLAHALIQIDYIYQNRVSHTEWLCQENNEIYGYTIDCNMRLSAVSREIYKDGRIVSFTLVHCIYNGRKYEWFRYHKENYQYDVEGLRICNFINLVQRSNYLINKVYKFERQNGFLVSYSECSNKTNENKAHYQIKKRRKA